MAPSDREVQKDDIIYEGEILFHNTTRCTLLTVPDRTASASQEVHIRTDRGRVKKAKLNELQWPRYAYRAVEQPQPGVGYLYRNAYGQKEPCIVSRVQPLTVRRLDVPEHDKEAHTACALDRLEHMRRWELLANPYEWQQCCPSKKSTDRTAEISRWRKFSRGSSEKKDAQKPRAKKTQTGPQRLEGGDGDAQEAVRFFPYARQGRIKVYFFAQDSTGYNDPVGQYEIIGNYREDTTAMKALKAGTPQHPKGEKCLEGVKAQRSANGSNGYDITFTGFRGHTYVVSMYDNKGEMVQQWFHTQFQVEEAELETAHGRRVKYTWRDLQISRPANWDAATATYKGEKIPMDSSRPSPHGARRRKKHKTLEHRPAWCPQSAQDLKKMKIVVTDVTPPAQRRAAAGGGKLAAAVAWPEERAYEEDQMKKIWSHNRVGGAKFYQLMRSMFIGITRDRVTEWVQAQGAYATTMKGGGGALMGYVTQPIIVCRAARATSHRSDLHPQERQRGETTISPANPPTTTWPFSSMSSPSLCGSASSKQRSRYRDTCRDEDMARIWRTQAPTIRSWF